MAVGDEENSRFVSDIGQSPMHLNDNTLDVSIVRSLHESKPLHASITSVEFCVIIFDVEQDDVAVHCIRHRSFGRQYNVFPLQLLSVSQLFYLSSSIYFDE